MCVTESPLWDLAPFLETEQEGKRESKGRKAVLMENCVPN